MLAFTATLALAFATRAGAEVPSATDQARARDAFERGSAAYRTGDFARAALEYSRADALDPNAAALRAALDAATLADDAVLGTELLDRATRAPPDADSRRAIDAARARFAHRTGRVVIRCAPTSVCLATVDGATVDVTLPKIVTVGAHSVVVQSGGGLQPLIVSVAADQTIEVHAATPAPASPAPTAPHDASRGGMHPAYFFVALGATAIAGGVSVWSAVDTKSRHTQFDDAACNRAPTPGCGSLASEGDAAQTRTNVMFAVSGALALATATLGVFVRWSGPHGESIAIAPNGPGAALRVGF
jgi:hypothetical protein